MQRSGHDFCDICEKHAYNCWCYPAYDDYVCRESHAAVDDELELAGQEPLPIPAYDRSHDDGIICFPSGPCPVKWCRRMDPHMHADSGIVPVPD